MKGRVVAGRISARKQMAHTLTGYGAGDAQQGQSSISADIGNKIA
jgi:hypothetical protein